MSQTYSPSMAAKLIGVAASTLKQWEKHFPQLLANQDSKGKTFYTDKEIELLKQIFYLTKERGFTLEGAHKEMQTNHEALEKRQQAIRQLQSLRDLLLQIKEQL